jgi:hypothetical protein
VQQNQELNLPCGVMVSNIPKKLSLICNYLQLYPTLKSLRRVGACGSFGVHGLHYKIGEERLLGSEVSLP